MKRRLVIATVFLLAGAVVNLAVAWACALWSPMAAVTDPGSRVARLRPATPFEKRRLVEYGVVLTTDYAYVADLRGIGTARAVVFPITDQMARAVCVYGCPRGYDLYSAGWPAHCVAGFVQDDHPRKETHEYLDVIRVGPYGDGSFRQVPYRPMWLGLMVNTLFYAALLGLPSVVRLLVRVRQGLCPKCGYPIGESDACSECGKPFPERVRVST